MAKRGSLLLVVAMLAAAPASAAVHDLVLGGSGELFRAVRGRYSSLFAGAPAQYAADPVLALEIVPPGGGAAQRLLVPSTEGANVESNPYLFHDNSLNTVFLVWESRTNLIHSQINLISYGAEGWSEPIVLSPDSWSFKSSPQIAVTTDTHQTQAADGGKVQHRRTVVHTVWWEHSGDGDRTVYSPVVLVDGTYIGWNPIQLLDELDPTTSPSAAVIEPSLSSSPGIGAGSSRATVMLSFANPKTGRLLNIEVEVLPWQLTELAGRTRDQVLALANQSGSTIKSIADGARAHILITGVEWFNKPFVTSLANEAYAKVMELGNAAGGPRSLADAARAHILVTGVQISGHALGGGRLVRALEVAIEPEGGEVLLLQLRLAANLEAPATGEGPTTILPSPGGESALVAWEDGANQILYRERQGGGWSDVRSLVLGERLDREQAFQILEQRQRSN